MKPNVGEIWKHRGGPYYKVTGKSLDGEFVSLDKWILKSNRKMYTANMNYPIHEFNTPGLWALARPLNMENE